MSHEEPDVEVPERAKLEPALKQTGARVPDAPHELRGEITWQVIISGLIVAAIMGTAYPYMVLKLGFGPNVSVVAAFFGFLFLKVLDLVLMRRTYDRWQNNLAEAAGTSAAQTAFMCVLLGAFDLLREQTKHSAAPFHMELPWHTSFIWLTTAATLGVLMAVPLRRHFVVDEQLPYVDGLSTAETISVLDPPRNAPLDVRRAALNAFWAVMIGVLLSGMLMAFREDALFVTWIPGAWKPSWQIIGDTVVSPEGAGAAVVTGVVLAKMGVGVQWSLLSVGSGMLIGLRINVSMILGSTLAWVVAPYFLVKHGLLHDPSGAVITTPSKTDVLFWVMWPATGMLVAGGLTALALRWRLLVDTFRSLRSAKIDGAEFPMSIIVPGVVISAIALCVVQRELLGMPIWMTLAAILLSVPLMLVGLRVLGETNWGPISALSNMMQGLFAAVAPGNIAANMVASGTAGTVATSSEMIMQDYKCGHIIGTKPRLVTVMQLLAIPVGALAVSLIYPVLVDTFHLIETVDAAGNKVPPGLDSPISQKWSGFAQILREGPGALPSSALYMLVIFTILGVIFTVLESNKKIKKWVPSPTGIGIGILVSFLVVFTMFLGGVVGAIWEKLDKKSADTYMIPLGSGFIAGEALVAVVASIYFGATGG
ncbi:MAG TPA: OPT family oligopeptide transporter [Kofleriaceae bacterium]|nr:OPT family oligopeptide transporter [Kofleriaceae bacterium]